MTQTFAQWAASAGGRWMDRNGSGVADCPDVGKDMLAHCVDGWDGDLRGYGHGGDFAWNLAAGHNWQFVENDPDDLTQVPPDGAIVSAGYNAYGHTWVAYKTTPAAPWAGFYQDTYANAPCRWAADASLGIEPVRGWVIPPCAPIIAHPKLPAGGGSSLIVKLQEITDMTKNPTAPYILHKVHGDPKVYVATGSGAWTHVRNEDEMHALLENMGYNSRRDGIPWEIVNESTADDVYLFHTILDRLRAGEKA